MERKIFLFALFLWAGCFSLNAARVDTLMVKSPSMKNSVKVVFILPDKALGDKAQSCPVVYLLHGHGGNAKRDICMSRW